MPALATHRGRTGSRLLLLLTTAALAATVDVAVGTTALEADALERAIALRCEAERAHFVLVTDAAGGIDVHVSEPRSDWSFAQTVPTEGLSAEDAARAVSLVVCGRVADHGAKEPSPWFAQPYVALTAVLGRPTLGVRAVRQGAWAPELGLGLRWRPWEAAGPDHLPGPAAFLEASVGRRLGPVVVGGGALLENSLGHRALYPGLSAWTELRAGPAAVRIALEAARTRAVVDCKTVDTNRVDLVLAFGAGRPQAERAPRRGAHGS